MFARSMGCVVPLATVLLWLVPLVEAAPTPEQRREVNALATQIRKAGSLYTQGNYKESGEVVSEVQKRLLKLAEGADEDVLKLIEPIHRRVVRAHALLELEGVELEPMTALRSEPAPQPTSNEVSFTKEVAPLLVAKCGRCHVSAARGEFGMATYEDLMRGSSAGVVIFVGDPGGSRLIEVIESGDMPRGGGKLSDADLGTLKKWITQGAKFDGDNRRANLGTFASAGTGEEQQVEVMKATGRESVSFALDVAPVLAESCVGCHVNGQQPRANLNMSTFAGLLRGGDSGPPIRPRDGMNSLIVKRIKGEGGDQRMPMGRTPLSDEVIAKIEKWINEGATFDGPDPNQNITRVAALAAARNATHEELSARRGELAAENWRLGMGRVEAAKAETKNFLILGNVGEATLQEYGEQAEKLAPRVASMLGAASDKPLLKGRMTLYVFKQRYDYSEFGQMVERRELPKEWRGHWRYDVTDAYGAFLPPREDEYSLDGLIAQQLTGAYIASLGNPPRWFCEGTARVVASRLAAKDPRVEAWDTALAGVLASMARPADFLNGRLPAEDTDLASYSFLSFLMKDSRRFTTLLDALREGQPFDKSFALVYGAEPAKVAELWARAAAQAVRRKR